MRKNYLYTPVLLLLIGIVLVSCQYDDYENPDLKPINYSYTIPNRISFDFSQLSAYSTSIIPYNNSLSLKNMADSAMTSEFVVFAFESDVKNYSTLSFIERGNVWNLNIQDSLGGIPLLQTNVEFTDNNVIASILNFNDSLADHSLNGFYTGELNIHTEEEVFIKSVTCTGFIDYQGKFKFFVEDGNEDNIVVLQGNINSDNLISGNILKRDGNPLSPITNIATDTLNLDGTHLSGKIALNENSDARILEFNLNH